MLGLGIEVPSPVHSFSNCHLICAIQYYFVILFVCLACQTGGWRHYILSLSVRLSIHPLICYQNCEHNILKTYEPILKCSIGKGMKQEKVKIHDAKIVVKISFRVISQELSHIWW